MTLKKRLSFDVLRLGGDGVGFGLVVVVIKLNVRRLLIF